MMGIRVNTDDVRGRQEGHEGTQELGKTRERGVRGKIEGADGKR